MMLLANNPELYKSIYPDDFRQPPVLTVPNLNPDQRGEVVEFVPETEGDFAKMLATMRRMGYNTNEA